MKKLVFDFGNVIALFNQMEVYTDYTDNDVDSKYIVDLFDKKDLWMQMDKGQDIEKVYEKIIKKVDPRLHESINYIIHDWFKYLTIDQNMVSLIKEMKEKGHDIYLLSNFSKQFYEIKDENEELFNMFSGIYISSDRGYTKPSYMVYLDFLKVHNLKAEDCIFIDDKPENLENPKELGFDCYLYDGNVEKLRKYINSN